ncbi:MAG: hypothetical protein OEV87_06175 [Phycisphaerae bacterium]|nr:hypothetical protein [Phycisphaerae bacterium]
MKKNLLFKRLQALLLMSFIMLNGCTECICRMDNEKSTPNRHFKTPLKNGHKLLGNNKYPAIAYSGYRTTSRTNENCPTVEELKEDMKILAADMERPLSSYHFVIFTFS